MTTQRHLGGHDALPLGDERAFSATTVAPATITLVALESGNDAVVAAAGALGRPLVAFGRPEKESGGGGGGCGRDAVVVL